MSKKKIVVIVLVPLLLLFLLFYIRMSSTGAYRTNQIRQVSMIVYGSDSARWENLRQGAELACENEDAELTLVTMSSEKNAQEQIELIQREVAGGADALLIAACDSVALGEYIADSGISIPVVFVENAVDTQGKVNCVSADDYQMGVAIGQEIMARENPIVKVAIISDGTQRGSVQSREQGLRDTIEPYVSRIVTWKRYENEENMLTRKFLQRAMLEEAVDVVVALDNDTADALMEALDNLNRKTKVYAISTSSESVYYLDQRKIKALEYQEEYGIGYIGAQMILNEKDALKKYSADDIKYRVVNHDNMYEEENQTLLFPFVQ